MAEIAQDLNKVPHINESASRIENKQEILNSSSSLKSIDSCIKLLTEAKKIDNPIKTIANSNQQRGHMFFQYHSNSYRFTLTKNISKNPYISPSIKSKINEIMIDVNSKRQSYLSLYQSHSSKSNNFKYNCITSSSTPSLINKTNQKLSVRQDSSKCFVKPISQRVIAIQKPPSHKSITTASSNSLSLRLVSSIYNTPVYKSPISSMVMKPDVSEVKKKLFEQYQRDIDEFQKRLDIQTPKKAKSKYSPLSLHKNISEKKSLQLMRKKPSTKLII